MSTPASLDGSFPTTSNANAQRRSPLVNNNLPSLPSPAPSTTAEVSGALPATISHKTTTDLVESPGQQSENIDSLVKDEREVCKKNGGELELPFLSLPLPSPPVPLFLQVRATKEDSWTDTPLCTRLFTQFKTLLPPLPARSTPPALESLLSEPYQLDAMKSSTDSDLFLWRSSSRRRR